MSHKYLFKGGTATTVTVDDKSYKVEPEKEVLISRKLTKEELERVKVLVPVR